VADGRRRTASIELWLADPDWALDDAFERSCLDLLSEGEAERADRFIAMGARREYLVGRTLVRRSLSRFAPVEPVAWSFEENDHGRPAILEPEITRDLRFNLSHTRGLAALGIVDAAELGVDVEAIDRKFDFLPIARRKFAPEEAARVVAAAPASRRELFFRLWTLKEAFLKAKGIGLSLPLDKFSFDIDDGLITPTFHDPLTDRADGWHFALFEVGTRHRLAVAVELPAEVDVELEVRWLEGPGARATVPWVPIARSANWPAF